jgi:hypothetical protein
MIPLGKTSITYDDALAQLTEDQRLRLLYTMNTLLIAKGVYSAEGLDFQFRAIGAKATTQKKTPARPRTALLLFVIRFVKPERIVYSHILSEHRSSSFRSRAITRFSPCLRASW